MMLPLTLGCTEMVLGHWTVHHKKETLLQKVVCNGIGRQLHIHQEKTALVPLVQGHGTALVQAQGRAASYQLEMVVCEQLNQ
jgi:oxalate decarboxylase/phosphoglucose isomerase-like protein (cupin superfamily)